MGKATSKKKTRQKSGWEAPPDRDPDGRWRALHEITQVEEAQTAGKGASNAGDRRKDAQSALRRDRREDRPESSPERSKEDAAGVVRVLPGVVQKELLGLAWSRRLTGDRFRGRVRRRMRLKYDVEGDL